MENVLVMSKKYSGSIEHYLAQISSMENFRIDNRDKFDKLTNREIEILTLLAEGHNNPKVANELGISRNTVQNHRARIYDKLKINSKADIVKYALAFDLIKF